jgi:hypothetical protein
MVAMRRHAPKRYALRYHDKINASWGEGPKRKNLDFVLSPSWRFDNTPAPFGNWSPDLLLSGPEHSRSFSRSASCLQAGQGGANTQWFLSRPKASRRSAVAQPVGRRILCPAGAENSPFFTCELWCPCVLS